MALSNQRFVTTWTSEDSIQWRMYIIPSSVDYITPALSSNVTLPSEFLLRDMSLDTELGSIPAGLVSQVLKINVNIAALQGTTALNDLRADLLRGTTAKRVPLNSDGSDYLPGLTQAQREFDAFNTFVLQYNDGSGWKVAFIGCQKYSAENELEITSLDNVITYTIEIYDIFRCIGEIINQDVWVKALKPTTDTVALSSAYSAGEGAAYTSIEIGQGYKNYIFSFDPYYAVDIIDGNSYFHTQLFSRLTTKIGTMYSAYMRAITQKLTSSFSAAEFFQKTMVFYENQDQVNISPYLQYISEIWTRIGDDLQLVGGAHYDSKMFGQFTNFYEVYKSIIESSIEVLRPTYTFTSGTPDAYTLTMVADNPYPYDYQVTFNEDSTYSSLKIKLFSEALNQVNVAVSTITGESDTTEYQYGKQGTSGDNSKDLKIMFHNLPIITYRNSYVETPHMWKRNTINAGTLLYWHSPQEGLFDLKKVNTLCSVFFGGEDFAPPVPLSNYEDIPEYQMILEQQQSGLPTTIAQSLVNFLGRSKQAEASLTSSFSFAKGTLVSKRCIIDLSDYNTLLESIYGTPQAYCVMTKHSHKVYEGMCDITLRIDAEPE